MSRFNTNNLYHIAAGEALGTITRLLRVARRGSGTARLLATAMSRFRWCGLDMSHAPVQVFDHSFATPCLPEEPPCRLALLQTDATTSA